MEVVLFGAGIRWWGRRLRRHRWDHETEPHVLTHAHPDHQGTCAAVCAWFDVPLLCHEAERDAAETGHTAAPMPDNRTNRLLERVGAGPGHPSSGRRTRATPSGASR